MNLAPYIEYCCLDQGAHANDIRQVCEQSIKQGLFGVCVPPYFVRLAHRILKSSPVVLGTVAGFPIGYDHTMAKEQSVRTSVSLGARSVNIALNLAAIHSGNYQDVSDEVHRLATITRLMNVQHTFIFDLQMLALQEIETLCTIMNRECVDVVQLSTAGSHDAVVPEQVYGVRKLLNKITRIKVTDTRIDHISALQLIKAGADRIGTSHGLPHFHQHEIA